MAGYGLSDDNSLPVVLEENLEAKGYNIEIVDGSVSGSTSSGGLNRAAWTLSEPDVDLIILCLGERSQTPLQADHAPPQGAPVFHGPAPERAGNHAYRYAAGETGKEASQS